MAESEVRARSNRVMQRLQKERRCWTVHGRPFLSSTARATVIAGGDPDARSL